MRFTRRQVLKLAAAQGVLLSLPRTAAAAAQVAPSEGFVGAARLGGHMAVASTRRGASRIDFYSATSGRVTRPAVAVPAPLVVGGIAALGGKLHVGGHVLVEGPVILAEVGDQQKVYADSGDPSDRFDDHVGDHIEVRRSDLIPWAASMAEADAALGLITRLEDRRGVVRGFTPGESEPTVWIAECPEAATFSATAVRAWRGVAGPEIGELSLATGDADISSVLTVTDGTIALIASNDHGLARIWQVQGESISELRLPDESVRRTVLQVLVADSSFHVITADLEDGTVRHWRRSGVRWSRVGAEQRNLVAAGDIQLEMPNR